MEQAEVKAVSGPCVLLIGDSIRMGYCETVKRDLSDIAHVVSAYIRTLL